ncbi:MAG TPA: hypothetical protein VG273_21195 [Bryobacteraceae bacterium]|jgi:hypothetical protein|nr:hypothetical protein [Bryobacteraceae bacterium]
MSFLDSLENNLKALESLEAGGLDESKRRAAEREQAIASAPWADRLKNGPFTQALIQRSIRAGHTRRMKVHLAWIGTTLRLEARGLHLELRPAATGVGVVCLNEGVELKRSVIDLTGSPEDVVAMWMELLDQKKIADDLAVSALPEEE